jgi:hypothetical protein
MFRARFRGRRLGSFEFSLSLLPSVALPCAIKPNRRSKQPVSIVVARVVRCRYKTSLAGVERNTRALEEGWTRFRMDDVTCQQDCGGE